MDIVIFFLPTLLVAAAYIGAELRDHSESGTDG
jgi:hypothetical protein